MAKTFIDEIIKLSSGLSDQQIADIIIGSNNWKDAMQPFMGIKSISQYQDSAELFIQSTLGYNIWSKQTEIIKSVEQNKNTVVSSGHSTGKSTIAALLTCWWLSTKENSVVVTLAPTFAQVNHILWRYIRHMGRSHNLPGDILDTPRWNISPLRYAVGLSPKKTSQEDMASLQGYHSPNLLVIMDEAPGMPRIMFEAIMNLATSADNRILAIGNPISQSGPFWEACNSKSWNHIHISCLEHPNVKTGEDVIPGAVSREWVIGMINDHCYATEPHNPGAVEFEEVWYMPDPVFQVRVLGIAPSEADDQLISSSLVFSSQIQEGKVFGERVIGFDPARTGGDDSTMICREGGKILWIKRRRPTTEDISGELAGWLQAEITDSAVNTAYIDEIGSSAGVLDRARAANLPVIGVNVSRPAIKRKRFANLRAELYWKIRDSLRLGILSLPDDDLLAGDLTSIKYSFDHLGRVALENKEKTKNRINRSPDTGDALALSYAGTFNIEEMDDDDTDDRKERLALRAESKWTVPGRDTSTVSRWSVGNNGKRRFGKGQ